MPRSPCRPCRRKRFVAIRGAPGSSIFPAGAAADSFRYRDRIIARPAPRRTGAGQSREITNSTTNADVAGSIPDRRRARAEGQERYEPRRPVRTRRPARPPNLKRTTSPARTRRSTTNGEAGAAPQIRQAARRRPAPPPSRPGTRSRFTRPAGETLPPKSRCTRLAAVHAAPDRGPWC